MQKVKSGKTCWSYENSQSIKKKVLKVFEALWRRYFSWQQRKWSNLYLRLSFQIERDETSTHLFSLPPKAPPQERDSKTYDSDDSFNGKTSGVRGFYDSEHPDDSDFVGILIKTWLLLKKQQAIQPQQQRSYINLLRTIQLIVKVYYGYSLVSSL